MVFHFSIGIIEYLEEIQFTRSRDAVLINGGIA